MEVLSIVDWIGRENNSNEDESEIMLHEDPELEYNYYVEYCLKELNLSPNEIVNGFGNMELTEPQERFIEDFLLESENEESEE